MHGRYKGKTLGLCGTFNEDVTDDFTKPDTLVTTNTQDFATSWKIDKQCHESLSPQTLFRYWDECSKLKKYPFKKCHDRVKVDDFIKDCQYDAHVCACNVNECFCEAFDVYVTECSAKDVFIKWKNLREFSKCSKFHQFQLLVGCWKREKTNSSRRILISIVRFEKI